MSAGDDHDRRTASEGHVPTNDIVTGKVLRRRWDSVNGYEYVVNVRVEGTHEIED